jgi:hypothetical protein
MGAAHSIDADAGEPERGWSVAEPPADVFLCVLAQLRRDWPARAAMRATCRGWARLAGDELTWKALCGAHGLCLCAAWVCSTLFAPDAHPAGLLAAEYPLAVPATLAGAPSWRALFLEAHPGTARFHAPCTDVPAPCAAPASEDEDAAPAEAPPPGVFTIDVCVRFRPPGLDGVAETAPPPAAPLVVPLHARFQMLKARHGGGNLEAARRVWGAKAADADPWATAQAKEAEAAAAEAAARAAADAAAAAKAKAEAEAEAGAAESAAAGTAEAPAPVAAAVLSTSEDAVLCLVPGTGLREFRFRRVFDDRADAAAVYDGTAARLVAAFLNGTSGALLAYGQTGAGKTHSLHGPDEAASCSLAPLRKEAGVVPRAAAAVLCELDRRAELARLSALGQADAFWAAPEPLLFASYVEIYGEEVRDLLSASAARVGAWGGVAAAALAGGAAAVRVRDAKHLETLLATAEKAKKRAATAMNARSSRAHALLTFRLVQPGVGGERGGPDDAPPLVSWLVFADLGGCERVKRSGVEGERLAEAVNIKCVIPNFPCSHRAASPN